MRTFKGKWRWLAISLAFSLIFQNCSGFNSLNSISPLEPDISFDSLLALGQKTCNASLNPDYRTSLLTRSEISNVISDLFPREVAANTDILKKVDEISEINIDAVNDQTLFSENNSNPCVIHAID